MNLTELYQEYLFKLIDSVTGLKTLILDDFTQRALNTCLQQHHLEEHNIVLTMNIDDLSKLENDLSVTQGIFFIRPVKENLIHLEHLVSSTFFAAVHLYFTANPPSSYLENLARIDSSQIITSVGAVSMDFIVNTPFSIDAPSEVANVVSALVAIGVYPSAARTQKNCDLTSFAEGVWRGLHAAKNDKLISAKHFASLSSEVAEPKPCTLLFVDRSVDRIAPLIRDWTFLSCMYQFSDYADGIVNTGKEKLLASFSDPLFDDLAFKDFGSALEKISEKLNEKAVVDSKDLVEMMATLYQFSGEKGSKENLLQLATFLKDQAESFFESGIYEQKAIGSGIAVKEALSLFARETDDSFLAFVAALFLSEETDFNKIKKYMPANDPLLPAISELYTRIQQLPRVNQAEIGPKQARGEGYFLFEPQLHNVVKRCQDGQLADAAFPVLFGDKDIVNSQCDVIVVMRGGVALNELTWIHGLNQSTGRGLMSTKRTAMLISDGICNRERSIQTSIMQ